jgi:hypothetical protein
VRGARNALLVSVFAFLLLSLALPGIAAQPFEVFFQPPGLLVRGEPATLFVLAGTPPPGFLPIGNAYVRGAPGAAFTRVRLVWDEAVGALKVRVPAGALGGSVLDSYVVVHDPASGETVTIPPAAGNAPYRSWIIDPPTLRLPNHVFGDLRSPDAIVARAPEGGGPGEVGVSCTGVNGCYGPRTFDVARDGTVWVADTLNGRLQAWPPGHPRRPTRTIDLDVTPSDVAIGPDGTIYLSGCCAPDHDFHNGEVYVAGKNVMRALTPRGRTLWETPLLGEIENDQIRVGSDGVVYTQDFQYGWAPATDRGGHPLSLAQQQRLVQPYQPVAGGEELAVQAGDPRDWRIGLATRSGDLLHAWRLISTDDMEGEASSAVVGGDPVLVFRVDDVKRRLKENEVVVLSSGGGIAESFSIGWGAALGESSQVTDVRVGPDGYLYLMQTGPKRGLFVLRYRLVSTPTPKATLTVTPTGAPTSTPAGSVSASIPAAASPTPRATWVVVSLGGLAVAVGLALWLRRRGRGNAVG